MFQYPCLYVLRYDWKSFRMKNTFRPLLFYKIVKRFKVLWQKRFSCKHTITWFKESMNVKNPDISFFFIYSFTHCIHKLLVCDFWKFMTNHASYYYIEIFRDIDSIHLFVHGTRNIFFCNIQHFQRCINRSYVTKSCRNANFEWRISQSAEWRAATVPPWATTTAYDATTIVKPTTKWGYKSAYWPRRRSAVGTSSPATVWGRNRCFIISAIATTCTRTATRTLRSLIAAAGYASAILVITIAAIE